MSEYKRFTERTEIGEILYDCGNCARARQRAFCNKNNCEVQARKRLAELEDKIENGTLIELPCKVGDKVYFLCGKKIIEEIVTKVKYEVTDGGISQLNSYILTDDKDDRYPNFHRLSKLGKSLFLTKAEAEAKLEELNGEV